MRPRDCYSFRPSNTQKSSPGEASGRRRGGSRHGRLSTGEKSRAANQEGDKDKQPDAPQDPQRHAEAPPPADPAVGAHPPPFLFLQSAQFGRWAWHGKECSAVQRSNYTMRARSRELAKSTPMTMATSTSPSPARCWIIRSLLPAGFCGPPRRLDRSKEKRRIAHGGCGADSAPGKKPLSYAGTTQITFQGPLQRGPAAPSLLRVSVLRRGDQPCPRAPLGSSQDATTARWPVNIKACRGPRLRRRSRLPARAAEPSRRPGRCAPRPRRCARPRSSRGGRRCPPRSGSGRSAGRDTHPGWP